METTEWKCDCGCGVKTTYEHEKTNWLVLLQPHCMVNSSEPKLERNFHFKSLECLAIWSEKAQKIGKDLSQNAINGPRPRGALHSKDLPGVYV